jgi:hypothetical protein
MPLPAIIVPSNPDSYGVAQLAAALNVSKPTVTGWLGETQPTGQGTYQAAAWTFDVLPAKVKEGLATQATRSGMPIAGYLESSARPWQPKVPLARVSPIWIQKAENLRAAILPTWERQRDSSVSKSEIQRLGLEDYKRVLVVASARTPGESSRRELCGAAVGTMIWQGWKSTWMRTPQSPPGQYRHQQSSGMNCGRCEP